MNTNSELFTLLHQEKTTLIVITVIPAKFTSIYDVRTPSVCLTVRLAITHSNGFDSGVIRSYASLYAFSLTGLGSRN